MRTYCVKIEDQRVDKMKMYLDVYYTINLYNKLKYNITNHQKRRCLVQKDSIETVVIIYSI